MNSIYETWPWFVSGPLIAAIMLLLILMGKKFGMSSNFRTLCTACGAGKYASFFRFDWKKDIWNLWVALGLVLGGLLGSYLSYDSKIELSESTKKELALINLEHSNEYAPEIITAKKEGLNGKSIAILALGGLFIGFGTRYAGGCTSGHAISGLSNLQLPSLIAVIGFFIGGLTATHFLFPLIF